MTTTKVVSVTFYREIDRSELDLFLAEVPPGIKIRFSHSAGDQREPSALTLSASLPLTRLPNMHPDAGGPR